MIVTVIRNCEVIDIMLWTSIQDLLNVTRLQVSNKVNINFSWMSISILTSSMRPCSRPMVSGRLASLLLLAFSTLRGKLHRQAGREPSWLRLKARQLFFEIRTDHQLEVVACCRYVHWCLSFERKKMICQMKTTKIWLAHKAVVSHVYTTNKRTNKQTNKQKVWGSNPSWGLSMWSLHVLCISASLFCSNVASSHWPKTCTKGCASLNRACRDWTDAASAHEPEVLHHTCCL